MSNTKLIYFEIELCTFKKEQKSELNITVNKINTVNSIENNLLT